MKKSKIDPIVLAMGCTEKLMPDPIYVVVDKEIISKMASLESIHERDAAGRTLLMYAALYERNAVVQYLLSRGADVHIKDKNQHTALHFAVQSSNIDVTETLLKAGADANARDKFGNSPLLRCNHTSLPVLETLLEYGADPMQKNKYGVSAADAFAAEATVMSLFDSYISKV